MTAPFDEMTKPMSEPPTPEAEWVELHLYVTGNTANSMKAMENLHEACELRLPGRYHVEVVDLTENPRRAAEDQILVVPTVVRRLPAPARKVIGDLSDLDSLHIALFS
jgi:circadian clock protein KaiB